MNEKCLAYSKTFSLRCNLKGAKVLKFCPRQGAVKIFVLMGGGPPLLQEYNAIIHKENAET